MTLVPSSSSGAVSEFADSVQGAGTATAGTAGSAFATIVAASLPAGIYLVRFEFLISTVADAASTNNCALKAIGGASLTLYTAPTGASQNVLISGQLDRVTLDGTTALKLVNVANVTATCVYTGTVQATRVA